MISKNKIIVSLAIIFFVSAGALFFSQSISKNSDVDKKNSLADPNLVFTTKSGKFIYVFSQKTGKISKMKSDGNKKIGEFNFGSNPENIYYIPSFQKIYAILDNSKVGVMKLPDVSSDVKNVSLEGIENFSSRKFFYDTKNKKIFVVAGSQEQNKGGLIFVINPEDDFVANIIKLDGNINPDFSNVFNEKLFIYDYSKKSFIIVDQRGITEKTISLPDDISADDKMLSDYNGLIYFADKQNLIALDPYLEKVVSKFPIKPEIVGGKIDKNAGLAYLVSSNSKEENGIVSIIDIGNQKISEVEVGLDPREIKYDDNYIYIGNYGSNSVSVINKKERKIVKNITSGGVNPIFLAVDKNMNKLYVYNTGSSNIGIIDLEKMEFSQNMPNLQEKKSNFIRYILPGMLLFFSLILLLLFAIKNNLISRKIKIQNHE
jgi:YVTN family beta-propeller protein